MTLTMPRAHFSNRRPENGKPFSRNLVLEAFEESSGLWELRCARFSVTVSQFQNTSFREWKTSGKILTLSENPLIARTKSTDAFNTINIPHHSIDIERAILIFNKNNLNNLQHYRDHCVTCKCHCFALL